MLHEKTIRSLVLGLFPMVLVAAPSAAQSSAARYVADFERMRANVLAMVDSMSAAGLRTAPTEGVRDFAEQIEHVAIGNVKRMVNVALNRGRDMISAMDADALAAEGRLFGQMPFPKWQIVEAAFEHGIWTLGATVPYVRMQGGVPHSFGIAPTG